MDPSRRRHAERRHSVEHAAPDFRLGPLIGQSPGVKAPTDDGLVGPNERTVLFCSISGQTENSRGEANGLGEFPERPKSVRVFRHLFRTDPDIIAGEIDMLPAKRGQMDQQMIRDIFGLA